MKITSWCGMSACTQAAFGQCLDAVQRQSVHVDQMRRCLDLELHQVQQVGAAGDELCAWMAGDGGCSMRRGLRAFVGEGLHDLLPATSVIASMMFE
jgi:hypothetical protein